MAAVANKYLVTIAGQQVEVERWGSGPKAVIFFSHTGNLAGIFRANAALVQSLVGEEYSAFTWTYPSGPPFDRVFTTLSDWRAGLVPPTGRLLFPGVASSMLAQLRAATGLQEFVLVGNSLGAGVVLSDYETLAQDPDCTMLLISPTEPFIPPMLPEYLQGALMMSDPYSLAEEWLRRDEDRRFCFKNTTLPPPSYRSDPGHFTIFDAQDIAYAFDLLGYASKPRGSVVTVSPANAEALWGNALKRIDWFAAFGPEQVKLELLKNGQPVSTLVESTFNSGRFDWQIPGDLVDGVDYSIRVSSLAVPSNSGGDDLRFAIQTIPAGHAVDYAKVAWETGSFARFNDAMGDVNVDGITNVGNGILDIVKMEITDTAEDIIFALTVGGDVAAEEWGNFMIGIANQKSLGTNNGNGWLRPIALDAGGGYGMTHWIGSWINERGINGSELRTHEQTFWSAPASLKAFQVTPGAQSTLIYTVSKQSLEVANGDLIIFDAYSSGSGPDGAIDALSNSNVTITSWGGSYTSQARAGTTRTYKVGNSASITRQWFGQTNVSFDGMHALQSGLVNDNEVSYLQTILQGPGTLNFDWRVSSESGADFLRFAIPGASDAISGPSLAWQHKSFEIPVGPVLVRWTYEKDGGTAQFVQGTLDAGWVDNISYVPALVDGLPGWWWMEYFGTTDDVSASADADGDGFTNAQEYALGTIPTDPGSTFRLRAVSMEPSGAITISWDAVAGKTYQVLATGDLSAGPWQPVGEPVSASTSGPVSRSDSPAQPARFYRVILVP